MPSLKIYRRSELEAISPAPDTQGCLHRYKAIWIDKVDDTSDVALIGIAFAAIKHAYIVLLNDAALGQDLELAQEAFRIGTVSAKAPSRLLPDIRQLWMFHAEKFELLLDRFVASEERGSVNDVGFTPDLVYAHPDQNTLEVIDDKSGWRPPLTEDQVKALFQARVYSAYARHRWPGFTRYKFTIFAVRFNKATTVEFTNEELDAVELEVSAAISTIEHAHETGEWPAVAGPSCHFCELDCPIAHQDMALPKRILNLEFAAALAAFVVVGQKQIQAGKKLLKGYVIANGPLTVNGLTWDNRPSEARSYPIDVLMDVLTMRGGMGAFEDAANQGLTISHSALAKVFKAFPGLEDDLKNHVKTKTSYRFSAKNPEAQEGDDEE